MSQPSRPDAYAKVGARHESHEQDMQSARTHADAVVATLVDGVVECVCRDLKGHVPRSSVRKVATEVMARYPAPVVTAYIPIILRRLVREQFEVELR